MFHFFKIKKSERINARQPKNRLIWIKHGFSEFIGTIILSLGLAGVSTIATKTGTIAEEFLLHPVLVGFYAGFLVVGFVLIIFLRWSADLNPAVTIYRMLSGTNTIKYGFYKIIIQFIAGILTGLMIYGMGKLHNYHFHNIATNGVVANHAIIATNVASKWQDPVHASGITVGTFTIIIIEMVMTSILLWPIFSKNISNKYRDLLIMFVISMAVWMGILAGTAAINPARGLAQQVPGLFFGANVGNSSSMLDLGMATLGMEIGTLFSPFFLLLIQGLTKYYINPLVVKLIKFKNYKSSSMMNFTNFYFCNIINIW